MIYIHTCYLNHIFSYFNFFLNMALQSSFPSNCSFVNIFCKNIVFHNMMLCSVKNSETLLRNVSLHTTTQKTVFHMSLLSQPQISLKFLEHIPLLNDNICSQPLSSVKKHCAGWPSNQLVRLWISVTKIPHYLEPNYSSYSTAFFSTNLSRSLLSSPAVSYLQILLFAATAGSHFSHVLSM